ncbi:hypothetical protein [Micromonospora sp. WMMD710]|uniref:hypothetical protein n=1 Tax=Micromonospora sp. WMMD710 TaxID=3016085 RepID=UPI002415DA07|nr:hypothetical protein [Micromonospora sp. WMMD710]MDG4756549.1 hypothetical protein [Micromonospora sp. WMMD710]
MSSEFPDERWLGNDLVIDARSRLWVRADRGNIAQGWSWAYAPDGDPMKLSSLPGPEGSVAEGDPVRPLVILVSEGRRVR